MSQNDDDAAVAEFIRAKGVTRCPTACVSHTNGIVTSSDQVELKRYAEAKQEAALIASARRRLKLGG